MNADVPSEGPLPAPGVRASLPYYEEFLEQRAEVMKHKWIASEKAGHDVGIEAALHDWVRNQRPVWRAQRSRPGASNR